MRVEFSGEKSLEAYVDLKYSKSKRHSASKRLLDSLLWASENLLRCVVRERVVGGEELVKVCPELASTLAPTMSALTFLQAWAGLPPDKLAETITRMTMRVIDKEKPKGKVVGGRSVKADPEVTLAMSDEAIRRVESLNRRIEMVKVSR